MVQGRVASIEQVLLKILTGGEGVVASDRIALLRAVRIELGLLPGEGSEEQERDIQFAKSHKLWYARAWSRARTPVDSHPRCVMEGMSGAEEGGRNSRLPMRHTELRRRDESEGRNCVPLT